MSDTNPYDLSEVHKNSPSARRAMRTATGSAELLRSIPTDEWEHYKTVHPDWDKFKYRWFPSEKNLDELPSWTRTELEIKIPFMGHMILWRRPKKLSDWKCY